MEKSLDALEPDTSELEFVGNRLVIQPLVGSQVVKMIRLCQPIIKSAIATESGLASILSAKEEDADSVNIVEFGEAIVALIGDHGERVFEAIALAAKLKTEDVSEAPLDQIILLGFKVFEINRDFFVQKVLPLLGARARKYVGGGKTPSPSYSEAGIPEKTS